jgi:hypothetical protein
VVLLMVGAVGLEEELGLFGVQDLHLARERLADVSKKFFTRKTLASEDGGGGVAHGLEDHLRRVDERAVEVEEGGGQH